MSILTKPYEVSLWDDVWDGSCFKEKRLCVIGSNEMNVLMAPFPLPV